jgi:hypothetical protein
MSKVRSRSPAAKAGAASVLPAAIWKSETPCRTKFIRAMAAVMVISSCPKRPIVRASPPRRFTSARQEISLPPVPQVGS